MNEGSYRGVQAPANAGVPETVSRYSRMRNPAIPDLNDVPSTPALVAAEPLLAVLAELEADRVRLGVYEARAASVLDLVAARLRRAIEEARTLRTRVTVRDMVHSYGMRESTARWACKRHTAALDARKVRKEWTVDRTSLEAFLGHSRATSKHATGVAA